MVTKLQKKLDTFRSLRDRKIINKNKARRRERKIYSRMDNLIDDLHHKTINFLTKTFDHIVIPCFESQEMSKNIKIKGLNRNLLQMKHFLFRQRLEQKCLMRKCTMTICTEEYTTMTCGRCGSLKKVGSLDVYSCPNCKLVVDRDVNGARNILIKVLNESQMNLFPMELTRQLTSVKGNVIRMLNVYICTLTNVAEPCIFTLFSQRSSMLLNFYLLEFNLDNLRRTKISGIL